MFNDILNIESLKTFIYSDNSINDLNIITTKNVEKLTNTFFANITHIILFNVTSNDIDRIYKFLPQGFCELSQLKLIISDICSDYNCVILDKVSQFNNITNKIFWYEFDISSNDFYFGSEIFKESN